MSWYRKDCLLDHHNLVYAPTDLPQNMDSLREIRLMSPWPINEAENSTASQWQAATRQHYAMVTRAAVTIIDPAWITAERLEDQN